MEFRKFWERYRNRELDALFDEVTMVYNKVDDQYYIYKGEHFYDYTNDYTKALEIYERAKNEISK